MVYVDQSGHESSSVHFFSLLDGWTASECALPVTFLCFLVWKNTSVVRNLPVILSYQRCMWLTIGRGLRFWLDRIRSTLLGQVHWCYRHVTKQTGFHCHVYSCCVSQYGLFEQSSYLIKSDSRMEWLTTRSGWNTVTTAFSVNYHGLSGTKLQLGEKVVKLIDGRLTLQTVLFSVAGESCRAATSARTTTDSVAASDCHWSCQRGFDRCFRRCL